MSESYRQRPDGSWEPMPAMPEPFGVTWERCLLHRRRHGVPYLLALIYGWRDARALRRMERSEDDGRPA